MTGAGAWIRWSGRFAVAAAIAGVLAILPAGPADAHPPGIEAAVDYRVRVTGFTPAVDGLRVRFVPDGSRLELRSDTGRPAEVLGYDGEPMLRVGPDGAWENTRSPSLYVDRPSGAARAGASPRAQPQWRHVGDRALVRWQDHRTLWHGSPPPQTARDPGRVHRVLDWWVPIRVDGSDVRITGFVEWVPPPPGTWWLAVLVLIAAMTLAGWVAHRHATAARPASDRPARPTSDRPARPAATGLAVSVAVVGLAVGLAAIAYQVHVAVDNAAPGELGRALLSRTAALAVGLALIVGAVLTWLGRKVGLIILSVGGPLIALLAGLENVALLSHSVPPVTMGPLWPRWAEVIVLGGGLGLLGFALTRAGRARASTPRNVIAATDDH
jgi:hypothetical protein